MIELTDVTKTYTSLNRPTVAIDHLSLAVAPSDFLLITGASGAGKTTLLNLIGGMTRCDSGRIIVDNHALSAMKSSRLAHFRNAKTGFIFQFQSTLSTLTVLENVLLPFLFSRKKPDKKKALAIIHDIGLYGKEHAYPHHLSTGQIRRVAVAREMLRDSKVLLCDEPTGDLDPDTEQVVMRMIQQKHRAGTTVVLVSHHLALASFATRRIHLDHGKIQEMKD